MRAASRHLLLERIGDDDLVLDVGGWGDPFERADWVIDFLPFETRGFYERLGWRERGPWPPERFTEDTWVVHDICAREPWPFADGQFDFVICSHTLEDVRDPVWVCSELVRVGKAGYVEVPSRLEEQAWGAYGRYVGSAHHHWLVDVEGSHIDFVFKPHDIASVPDLYFPKGFYEGLSDEERVQRLWWEGDFSCRERWFLGSGPYHEYLREFVAREAAHRSNVR